MSGVGGRNLLKCNYPIESSTKTSDFPQIMSCRISLSDVNHVIRRLLGSTYKGHGEDFNTIAKVCGVFLCWPRIRKVKFFGTVHDRGNSKK